MHAVLRHPFLLALALFSGLAPVRASDLPPTEAKPFTGVFQMERRYRLPPDLPEWTTVTDTVTIAVTGLQSRWDYKTAARTTIYNYDARTLIDFGGKQPPNKALRLHFTIIPMPIGWEFGYGKASRVDGAKSEVVGKTTIAGHECTRVVVESEDYGKPEFCVASDGTVLRYENRGVDDGVVYEATSVALGPTDTARFQLPPGYSADDRTAGPPGSRGLSFDKPKPMSSAP